MIAEAGVSARREIRVAAGEHLTDGVNAVAGWHRLVDGLSIRGAGMFQTTVKLNSVLIPDAPDNKPVNCAFHSGFRTLSNILIEDLTIDCNAHSFPEHPEKLMTAVNLFGSNNVVRNVRVINSCAKRPDPASGNKLEEGFPLMLGAHDADATGLLIDGCIMDSIGPHGYGNADGYQTAISILAPKGRTASGDIRNCFVHGSPFGTTFAYGLAGTRFVRVTGNYGHASRGLNMDTPDNEGTVIENNRFHVCDVGMLIYFMKAGVVRNNTLVHCKEQIRLGVSDPNNLFLHNVVANEKKKALIGSHDGWKKKYQESGTFFQQLTKL